MIIDLIANIIQNIIFFNCYINKSRWNPNKRIQIKSIKKKNSSFKTGPPL